MCDCGGFTEKLKKKKEYIYIYITIFVILYIENNCNRSY